MPGNDILAPRVLELWLCMGDVTTLSLGPFILKTSLGCLGGSREQGAGGLRSAQSLILSERSVPGRLCCRGSITKWVRAGLLEPPLLALGPHLGEWHLPLRLYFLIPKPGK